MAELTLGRRPVHTIFDLLGRKENDLTYALGWACANVPAFTRALLADVYGTDGGEVQAIDLQRADEQGRTDVEILTNRAHLIIEAKRGWVLPSVCQLERYTPRFDRTDLPLRRLLALTECNDDFSRRHLPKEVTGITVAHRSWGQILAHAQRATHGVGTHQDRHLARQLVSYLKGVTTMQDPTSNIAYCVSLGATYPERWPVTPRQVLDRGIYFHPFGSRWPKVPDNYMAFRWAGHIRDVRHVEETMVMEDLHKVVNEIPTNPNASSPYLVYRLGPSIPMSPLPGGRKQNGKPYVYRDGRFRVALDLILTSASIHDAVAQTKARLLEAE